MTDPQNSGEIHGSERSVARGSWTGIEETEHTTKCPAPSLAPIDQKPSQKPVESGRNDGWSHQAMPQRWDVLISRTFIWIPRPTGGDLNGVPFRML